MLQQISMELQKKAYNRWSNIQLCIVMYEKAAFFMCQWTNSLNLCRSLDNSVTDRKVVPGTTTSGYVGWKQGFIKSPLIIVLLSNFWISQIPRRQLQNVSFCPSKHIHLTVIRNRQKQQILTFEKPKQANVWHFRLINNSNHEFSEQLHV